MHSSVLGEEGGRTGGKDGEEGKKRQQERQGRAGVREPTQTLCAESKSGTTLLAQSKSGREGPGRTVLGASTSAPASSSSLACFGWYKCTLRQCFGWYKCTPLQYRASASAGTSRQCDVSNPGTATSAIRGVGQPSDSGAIATAGPDIWYYANRYTGHLARCDPPFRTSGTTAVPGI
eukprot:251997-Rhodomonas_salina.4